jgi:PAS domain S-box-containing protein
VVASDGRLARLTGATGLSADSPARVSETDLTTESAIHGWPLTGALRSRRPLVIDDVAERFGVIPGSFWPEPTAQALALPVAAAGQEGVAALLVAGVNPRHPLDDAYHHFFGLVAAHIATALTNARAYEEERKRAEALAELDRAKTAFYSNVSHEFRTPLTLMLGPLEDTLAENNLPPEAHERLEVAHRNSLRLLRLVNTLLDFSRLEAGRIEAAYELTDLAALTAELASVFRSRIERAGMKLIVDCLPLREPVWVDREMWEKIVFNLLSNAFKFTFEGEIEVSLRQSGEMAELAVRDTGTGIPAGEIPHLFERFHRVRGARGRTFEGSGIGLALVQELIRLHGGAARVESEVGCGSRFIVTIPFGLDLHQLVQNVTDAATELTGAQFGSFFYNVVDKQGGAYMLYTLSGVPREAFAHFPMPRATDLFGPTFRGEGNVRIADVRHDPRYGRNSPYYGMPEGHLPVTSYLAVPVVSRSGEVLGGLFFGHPAAEVFTERHERIVEGLAAQTAVAMDNARLFEALRESEARFRNMADHAPVMIWVTEPDATCTYLSQSWYEFTGQAPEASLGFGWLEAVHPDDREEAERSFVTASQNREAFRLEYRLRRKDGEYCWTINSAQPRFAANGEFLGYIGSVIDITERKRVEAEREWLLAQEQELRAKAEATTRSKDEFLMVVSHELRQPLNSILGYTRFVRAHPEEAAEVAHYAEIIERSAKIQQRLIEDLLDAARIISGKLKIEAAPTDLLLVLKEALSVVHPAAEARRIDLIARLDNDPQPVIGDAARLQQIIWNLLQNTIKFTPEGGRVELHLERDNKQARIIVTDTGKGIEPEFLPHVFDRFSQSDMSNTRRHGGLSLGLALARQLVELHGGTIEAASEGIGKGATFTVTLPLIAPQTISTQPQARAIAEICTGEEAISLEESPRLDGVRVLVVDDQEDARLLVAKTLSEWGAMVTMAASGQEAIDLMKDQTFDVLVCDINMPDEDGYEVLRRIRALEYQRGVPLTQRIPAIALTAIARSEDRLRALSAGFQMHVAKPVELAELILVIATLTRSSQLSVAVD